LKGDRTLTFWSAAKTKKPSKRQFLQVFTTLGLFSWKNNVRFVFFDSKNGGICVFREEKLCHISIYLKIIKNCLLIIKSSGSYLPIYKSTYQDLYTIWKLVTQAKSFIIIIWARNFCNMIKISDLCGK
jgi:hypothetical protein